MEIEISVNVKKFSVKLTIKETEVLLSTLSLSL